MKSTPVMTRTHMTKLQSTEREIHPRSSLAWKAEQENPVYINPDSTCMRGKTLEVKASCRHGGQQHVQTVYIFIFSIFTSVFHIFIMCISATLHHQSLFSKLSLWWGNLLFLYLIMGLIFSGRWLGHGWLTHYRREIKCGIIVNK